MKNTIINAELTVKKTNSGEYILITTDKSDNSSTESKKLDADNFMHYLAGYIGGMNRKNSPVKWKYTLKFEL